MRNLRNIRFGTWQAADVTSTCWDPAKDQLLCTIGPTETNPTIELVRIHDRPRLTSSSLASWDALSPNPDVASDSVVSIHHFSDTSTTCVILSGGDICTVQEPDGFSEDGVRVEIVGSIDAGILAARWSPDDELLALTTGQGNLVLMGRSFDPIADVTMTANDLAASNHVSVGWGKKETQFEGRGAKALKDPTIPDKVDQGVLSPHDDGSNAVSWRGDGAFVAVNSIQEDRRIVRVYSREGVLDSVSEPVDGLEGSLSWRPAGNIIAGVQRLQDRVDVVFFERNGLRHGQFTLRSPDGSVTGEQRIELEWNSDSTVLAVILNGKIQFWTMGNYHWYLKQEVPVQGGFASVAWHAERALRFAAATPEAVILTEYVFTVARGSVNAPNDHGAVAVIDAGVVKVTPLRSANVPPPMSLFDLEMPACVIDVAFDQDNSLMAVLHRKGANIYQWQTKGNCSVHPDLLGQIRFGNAESVSANSTALQICFSASNELCVLVHDLELKIEVYSFGSSAEPSLVQVIDTEAVQTIAGISSFCGLPDVDAVAQDRCGRLLSLSGKKGLQPIGLDLPVQLPWYQMVNVEGRTVALGTTRNGHLYADSRLLAKNCTSFLATSDHLIFTTNNHFVKFIHLVDPEVMEVPADDPETDERCRSIERGARLVTAIPTNMSLVLQMPRGNLETIYPRAMVVAGIRKCVDEKNYGRAFSFCRTQRVDMNILYDHQPEQFLSNVGLFLDQLGDVAHIDLFLSSLREEDVAQSMYRNTKQATQVIHERSQDPPTAPLLSAADPSAQSKVNKICNAILKSLQSRKATNLQNMITAHVCKVPPALDDGLTLVADLMQEDEKTAETAVEHVCFLVDVHHVYDNALGLYNLDLALLVAQQSQRDPREYLPFIQNLHQLPELRRRFEIDDHLDRRARALTHLKALDAFDELLDYTVKHALYREALGLFRYEKDRHRALTNLYAEHLESQSKFRDAGLAYEVLENYAKATTCYRAAGASSWRECLFAAQQQQPPLTGDALTDLASVLADALTEAKEYASAATIHLEYLDSLENAVRSLCKGSQFADALRLLARYSRQDLVSSVFDPALADALSSTTEFLADCKAQLKSQVPRVLELRRRAEEDPLAFYEGERPNGAGDVPDDVSVAASSRISTSASLFTRYTGKAGSVGTLGTGVSRATSKNRKREEKKRARGRKGTVYEEEYLVNSVRRLVERVNGLTGEVSALVFALVRRDMGERARAVESLMADVLEGCRSAVAELFGPANAGAAAEADLEVQQASAEGPSVESFATKGGAAVYSEHLLAQGRRQEPPAVSAFEKLSLLGS